MQTPTREWNAHTETRFYICAAWPFKAFDPHAEAATFDTRTPPIADYARGDVTPCPPNRKQMTLNDEYKAEKRPVLPGRVAESPDDDDLC